MSSRIMVVDDDDNVLLLLEALLKRQGYSVIKAKSGAKALEILDAETPDLFILDIMMPNMNGYELCRHIRSRTATTQTPIIIASARPDEQLEDNSAAVGANLYLSKLAIQRSLLDNVRQLLGQRVG